MAKPQDDDIRWLMGQLPVGKQRGPQPIAEVLSRLMARRGYANAQIAYEWIDLWNQVAGPLASRTRPGRFSRGVLEIFVVNSATLQELTFDKKRLLAAIGQRAPQFKVKDLRFKVGEV